MAFALSARNAGRVIRLVPPASGSWAPSFAPPLAAPAPDRRSRSRRPPPRPDAGRSRRHLRTTPPARDDAAADAIRPGQRIHVDPSGGAAAARGGRRDRRRATRGDARGRRGTPRPFADRIRLRARGGDGGSGCLAYHSLGAYKRRACGGHGGRGGDVYLVTDESLSSLAMEGRHFAGGDGVRGGRNGRNGRGGRDVYVRVPCGVVVRRVLDVWEGSNEADSDADENVQVGEIDDEDDEGESDQGLEAASGELDDGGKATDGDQDENDETFDDDDNGEDFDAYYERVLSSKEYRRRNQRRSGGVPDDYDDVVNTGVRAADGMFHWSAPENDDDDAFAATAYPRNGRAARPARRTVFVADLDRPHASLLVAEGGKPGVGNQAYANRPHTPGLSSHMARKAVPGEGETAFLELELKLIADAGLVGFPNAGKSSLLSAMSRARPKIASYPFTTLHPLVGTIRYKDGHSIVMADVPGLIDGAAEGRGRGIEFLRHIERTKVLVYMVDVAGEDGRDPVNDLRILGKELREYGSSGIFGEAADGDGDGEYGEELRRRRREIMDRPSLILANKVDLLPGADVAAGRREELLFRLGRAADEVGIAVCEDDGILGISAGVTGEGLRAFSRRLRQAVKDVE